jgi:hypothetical protein
MLSGGDRPLLQYSPSNLRLDVLLTKATGQIRLRSNLRIERGRL